MSDPANTFVATYRFDLTSFDPDTGYYELGLPLIGAHTIGDDTADTDLSDGSPGNGLETQNEAVNYELTNGNNYSVTYSGYMINGAPIIYDTHSTFFFTDESGLEGTSGLAAAGNFFYPVCFVAGTQIATPTGERAIESLQIGDIVTTAAGAQKPVTWIGRMRIPLTRFNRETAVPICVKRGALGNGLPKHDLYVSNDHAIAIDGLLVIAGLLVNGTSIVRCDDFAADVVEYFHIELDEHDLLLAEGVASESLFDDGKARAKFDNAAEFAALYPDHVPGLPMSLGRVASMRQMPKALRARLAASAA
jgi:hypothetical protein